MSELIIKFITYILKGIFVLETLNYSLKLKRSGIQKILLLVIYVIGYWIVEPGGYKEYIYRHLYTILVFYYYSKDGEHTRGKQKILLCACLGVYEIINTVMNLVTVMLIYFLPFEIRNTKLGMVMVSCVGRVAILYFSLNVLKNVKLNLEKLLRYKTLIYVLFLLTVCMKIPFLYTNTSEVREWKVFILAICFCTTIFFILSQLERRNNAKEKARIEESNKTLSAKLHKSQEILPAMVQMLSDVTEKNGTEMEEHKAHKLLEEVSSLYNQQIKENEKQDLKLKNFTSTGLAMLDQQLNVYYNEAIEREYNLDIFVQMPIDNIVKQQNIDQLRLQRAVGDLIRNAFRAVGKTQGKGGHILLIIGCQHEEILEIAVMDDGVEIPLHVLEAFGQRGITTGGTGNGLADICEFAKDAKASIHIDEFEEEDSFKKKISIIFNGLERHCLNTTRKDAIKSSIWNNKN